MFWLVLPLGTSTTSTACNSVSRKMNVLALTRGIELPCNAHTRQTHLGRGGNRGSRSHAKNRLGLSCSALSCPAFSCPEFPAPASWCLWPQLAFLMSYCNHLNFNYFDKLEPVTPCDSVALWSSSSLVAMFRDHAGETCSGNREDTC